MSVLLEALSVIVRCDRAEARYPGGTAGLKARCPNQTFCTDGRVARVGFMTPDDVGIYIEELAGYGLVYLRDGKAVDLVVVDERQGAMAPADWLECFRTDVEGFPVTLCCLRGTKDGTFRAPDDWEPGREPLNFVPNEELGNLTNLGSQGVNDVFRDERTGLISYVGRAFRRKKDGQ